LDCTPDSPRECGPPIDTPIELRFDRFLLPGTVNRQAFAIYTGEPGNRVGVSLGNAPPVVYDVVERVVTIRLDGELFQPHTLYTVELATPDDDYGFRAFDGAPLEPTTFSFYTNGLSMEELEAQRKLDPPPPAALVPTCSDVLTWLSKNQGQAQCSACHGSAGPRSMGLNLDDGVTLIETAIDRVAHQTNVTGVTGGTGTTNPARFGINMPIVHKQEPSNSYLLYKLLINPANYRRNEDDVVPCQSVHLVSPGEDCLTPSAEEIARLRDWFVRGEPMPYSATVSLYQEKLQGIQAWIQAGASCE
jgi:hypothetical protein